LPPSDSDVDEEDLSENLIHDEVLDPLSMAHCSPESSEFAKSRMSSSCTSDLSSTIEVGVQVTEAPVFDSVGQSRNSRNQCSSINSEVPTFRLGQSSMQESFLDLRAPIFVPEQSAMTENHESVSESLDVGTQTLAESPVDNSLATCAVNLFDSCRQVFA